MTNVEEMTMFEQEDPAVAEARRKALAEKRKADEKFLTDCRCFKELLMGKDKEWDECKKYIASYMFKMPQLGGHITADFMAGIRFTVEMLDELPGKWNKTFEQLGKEE